MSKLRPILVVGEHLERLRKDWKHRYRVHTLGDFSDVAAFLSGAGADVEVIVSDGLAIPEPILRQMPRLRLVACFSTGYAGIDTALLQSRGIALTNAAGVNAHDVADHAVALLLAAWNGLLAADALVRQGGWREAVSPRRSLRGRRVGILGFGRIGSAVAARLAPHEVSLAWYGPNPKPEVPYPRFDSALELARGSDILVVASRATAASRYQLGEAEFEALGREGLLVNVSRGLLVDEVALVRCLQQGKLGGAALDVFEDEPPSIKRWQNVPNVLLSPHVAGFTREAGPAMMALLEENVRRYFAGEALLTPVW